MTSRGNFSYRLFRNRNYLKTPVFESGGGGLVSTTMDYLQFCQMLLNDGQLNDVRILGRKSVELMRANHLGDIQAKKYWNVPLIDGVGSPGIGFGLTFAINLNNGQVGELGSKGEYYWGGAAGTRFWIDPEKHMVILFMVNILPYGNGAKTFSYGDEVKLLAHQATID